MTNTKKTIPNVILSIFLLAAIPIVIYTTINTNFDQRNLAKENIELDNTCNIILPYVNNKTLQVGKKYQIVIYADFENEDIQEISIQDQFKNTLFSKIYPFKANNISDVFTLETKKIGEVILQGTLKTNENSYECKLIGESLFVQNENNPPIFLTNPQVTAQPRSNTLEKGEEYLYTIEAIDNDADKIQYHYNIKPKADWLKTQVIQNGEYGKLEIRLEGIPTEYGKYNVEFYIHDGYKEHISVQNWEINVQPKENETEVKGVKGAKQFLVQKALAYENSISLNSPTITDLNPARNAITTNPKETISVTLNTQENTNIIEESITFELNSKNIFEETKIIKISSKEYILKYNTKEKLPDGEHKVKISFENSEKEKFSDEWNWTINSNPYETDIFGLPGSTVIIIVLGFFLLLFSLSIPWILYIAWKRNTSY